MMDIFCIHYQYPCWPFFWAQPICDGSEAFESLACQCPSQQLKFIQTSFILRFLYSHDNIQHFLYLLFNWGTSQCFQCWQLWVKLNLTWFVWASVLLLGWSILCVYSQEWYSWVLTWSFHTFLRSYHIDFHNGYTNLHSHQHWRSVTPVPNSCL